MSDLFEKWKKLELKCSECGSKLLKSDLIYHLQNDHGYALKKARQEANNIQHKKTYKDVYNVRGGYIARKPWIWKKKMNILFLYGGQI